MKPVSTPINPARRRTLQQLAAVGAVLTSPHSWGQETPDCLLTPAQTEGPYFVPEAPQRTDIRSDPATGTLCPGIPLQLQLQLLAVRNNRCGPLANAVVDIWHCDANGLYSGVRDRYADTSDQQFLRGYQISDTQGMVHFTTIYPGWYPGRAVHIHFKVRADAGNGRMHLLTSQLYFDDRITDQVYRQPPYAGRDPRSPRNAQDGIYRRGGTALTMAPVAGAGAYMARFAIGVRTG
ncbi:MAG: twin-arginine translocation pathway signal protein [Thiothrix sp.]|nr:twin-arginine translocation pathway signal protein [Thiothrix sp.]